MREEQEYRQYIYNNLLIDICEKLDICSRDFFIIKYDLSSEELSCIDNVFKELALNNIIDFSYFKHKIIKEVGRFEHSPDEVFKTLLESYKLYQPISQKILDNM